MSRSGCVMPRASHRAMSNEMTPATTPADRKTEGPGATPPADRNCHQTLWRKPSVAEIRPRVPREGEGCIAVTHPPSEVGTLAYVIRPVTPQCGTPSLNSCGKTGRCAPWTVIVPSGDCVTIEEPAG